MKSKNRVTFGLKQNTKKLTATCLYLFVSLIIFLLLADNLAAQDIDLIRVKGQTLVKGNNDTPVNGDGFNIKSYRIEKITLPESYSKLNLGTQKVIKVCLRLVITGKFEPTDYTIWLNGSGHSAYVADNGELQMVIFGDKFLFDNDTEIAVSNGSNLDSEKILLPESLNIPSDLLDQSADKKGTKLNITLSYISCNGALHATEKNCIQIAVNNFSVETDNSSNHGWYLQIGDKEFLGGQSRFIINIKAFENLKNDDWIVLKSAPGVSGGLSLGKLNKSSLH